MTARIEAVRSWRGIAKLAGVVLCCTFLSGWLGAEQIAAIVPELADECTRHDELSAGGGSANHAAYAESLRP